MFGVKMERDGDTLTITVDLKSADSRPSRAGKSMVVASTEGNENVPGDGGYRIGLNVYRPIKEG